MPSSRARFILSACTFISCLYASAFSPEVKNFCKEDYSAASQNWDICQNGYGVMYFANNGGILSFDSLKWKKANLMNFSSVRSVWYEEENSRVYAAGTGEVGYLDMNDGGRYVRLLDGSSCNVGEIWNFTRIADKFCFRDNSHVYFLRDSSLTATLEFRSKVEHLAVIRDTAYAATSKGEIVCIDADGNSWQLGGCGLLEGQRVCGIFDRGGGLLILTNDGKIFLHSPDTEGRLREIMTGLVPGKGEVFCAALNGDKLAVGTISKGIFIVDPESGRTEIINKENGLQNNSVLSLHFDMESNLWAGLDNGIDFINLQSPEERLNDRTADIGSGYAALIYGNKLFLGTNRGLFVTENPESSTGGARAIETFCNLTGQVWSLQAVDGELLCCHDLGLYVSDGEKLLYHIPLPGIWKVITLKEHPGMLLGCTYERLIILHKRNGKWEYAGPVKGFDKSSKEFAEDSDGRIWFSHWIQGLYRLSLNEKADSVERVESFGAEQGFPTSKNNIPHKIGSQFIFSTEGGFFRYDETSRKAEYLNELNAQFNGNALVTGITEFPDGTRYFSSGVMQAIEYRCSNGEVKLDSLSLKKFVGKRPIGFDNYCPLEDGKFIINTEDGFSIISTDKLNRRGSRTRAFIDGIVCTKSSKKINPGNGRLRETAVKLEPEDNSLVINFVWPEYTDASSIRYKCMMEGYDNDWSAESTVPSKEYTKLSYGKHVFRLRAVNPLSGQWSEDEIGIDIRHPWYLSWPAYIFYALSLLGLLFLTYRLIVVVSEKKAAALARKKEAEMEQRHLKAELEHKAEDLAVSTMNLIRKNEILQEIDAQIMKAADCMKTDSNRTGMILTQIRQGIRENIAHDNDWQKFEKNFDVVYDDFLKRLGEKYPALTVSDKKMCAYLKMDLSSKDIAPLLNMTVRSVEMTRYRLRKKLGLDRAESLTGFLQNY